MVQEGDVAIGSWRSPLVLRMDIDPSIYFIVVVPDGKTEQASPMQGFSLTLCQYAWVIRQAALLPTNIYDFTDEGKKVLLARRMSGISPVNWYGQSPAAIRSMPQPSFAPFTLIVLPETELLSDYTQWAASSALKPTIVAKSGGDLSYEDLTVDGLQRHFLTVCDRIPSEINLESVKSARQAIGEWKAPAPRQLGYQVGGHNTVTPNLVALNAAGFEDTVSGRFDKQNLGLSAYVEQIVRTTNSILDEREQVGTRDLQRIFRRPPDLNLFAPSIYPSFFRRRPTSALSREEKKLFEGVQQALLRQSGYSYEARTAAQNSALLGRAFTDSNGKTEPSPHPLMWMRARELSLNTELMSSLAASEFSAVVRLPNEINRTLGSVRAFADHYRADRPHARKRLLAFRQVQNRLASSVPAEFLDLIRRSKTGIRVVSDAHLEWLNVDGLPLSIRKNCTRIPVTPGNLFVHNLSAQPPLLLTPDAFETVLVISALKRDDPIRGLFEIAFDTFEPKWRDHLRIKFVEVENADDLAEAINSFDGPLVIFDGHGSHPRNEAAKLRLGTNDVDVWNLKNKIENMPPIVVLSACDTHAADRNHATTANGFMFLGARTVLSTVFPLDARAAAVFAARLLLRVGTFLTPAIATFGQALTWAEVVSGMLRMQLLTDFLLQLLSKDMIDEERYEQIHLHGNMAINGQILDPFASVLSRLEEIGLSRNTLESEFESAIANSSVISYLQIGRPETILIDDRTRVEAQMKALEANYDLALNRERMESRSL
jgi:hypothetical protein